jgi:hypothetical protein
MKRTWFNTRVAGVVSGVGFALMSAASALAQADIVRPPKAEDPAEVSFPLTLGVAVLCIAVVAGINLMPSRRTHQD